MGFYDPCPWLADKHLYVAYTYRGQLHECVMGDLEPVDAPLRGNFLLFLCLFFWDISNCMSQPT